MGGNKNNNLFLSDITDGELNTIFKLAENEFAKYITSIVNNSSNNAYCE